MKKFLTSILLATLLFNSALSAQSETSSGSSSDLTFNVADSEPSGWLHANDGKKHWFTAIGGMLFFNVGLASYNRFILGSGWAQVGPDVWDHFWERKLEYDRDWYWTNFVLHPYQGGIYYQVSRNSNLNQLESFGVTLVGSAFWEYLCETNAPSTNDMIYTTVGSFAMGEMLYRLSLNADEISSLLGYAINPMRLWSQAWLRQKPLGTTRNIHELSLKFNVGTSRAYTKINDYDSSLYDQHEIYPFYFNPSISLAYNDPYGHDSNDPYSQFELEISAAVGKGSGKGADCAYKDLDKKIMYDIRIISDGMLFARAPQLSQNTDTTVGLVMEYQFDWHQFYELSALGPGLAIKQRVNLENSRLEWQLHGAWNILGTTDYFYYHRPLVEQTASVVRNYNMTCGGMTVLKLRYVSEKGKTLNLGFRGYVMFDFGQQLQKDSTCPSSGWEWIGDLKADFEIPVSRVVRIGVGDDFYVKRAFYKKVPDLFQFLNSGSVYAKLQLK
ncbi:MAG: DUF3943 domain-containing protein [Treponema sp.]|nr:DUF3943 domain-containing protein [Treponema sp.]